MVTRSGFEFGAGALCLDFANTLHDYTRGDQEDLQTYADLVRWSVCAAVIPTRARALLAVSARGQTQRLDRAREIRRAIYRVLSARIAGRTPEAADRDAFNGAARLALDGARLIWKGPAAELLWAGTRDP